MADAPPFTRAIVQFVTRGATEAEIRLVGPDRESMIRVPLFPRTTLHDAWRGLAPSLPIKEHQDLLKALRIAIGQSRYTPKEWEETLPDHIVQWALCAVNMASRGLNRDNVRVARMGVPSQIRRFRRQSERGCCGSREWKETGPDGHTYLLGFNYGH